MGRDKAFVEVGGRPMVGRVADALVAAGCSPVHAIGGDADRLRRLGIEMVADRFPGLGPLGGIVTALLATRLPTVVVATDLAWLDADTIRLLVDAVPELDEHVEQLEQLEQVDVVDVVMARTDRLEPLCALWLPSAAGPLGERLSAGERAVHRAISGLRRREVTVMASALVNVNHPGDLAVDLAVDAPDHVAAVVADVVADVVAADVAAEGGPEV
jgi:molybdenum cofactor guanylyltransferase